MSLLYLWLLAYVAVLLLVIPAYTLSNHVGTRARSACVIGAWWTLYVATVLAPIPFLIW